jgi:hypothetical protein
VPEGFNPGRKGVAGSQKQAAGNKERPGPELVHEPAGQKANQTEVDHAQSEGSRESGPRPPKLPHHRVEKNPKSAIGPPGYGHDGERSPGYNITIIDLPPHIFLSAAQRKKKKAKLDKGRIQPICFRADL